MPTPKQQAKEAVAAEKESGDKYSVESLRSHMSTGGGEPIEKGHKMTNERRVLQPRDPDTGQFEFNSSANYGRKYPDRSKEGHAPIAARGWLLGEGVKKGQKVNIGDKIWIAIDDISEKDLVEYFKNFDEATGEFVNGNKGLSSSFIRKHGRPSKEEREGIESGNRFLGEVDLSSLGATSQKEMQQKMVEAAKGLNVGQKYSLEFLDAFGNEKDEVNPDFERGFIASTDWNKYVENAHDNYMKDDGAVSGRFGEDKNNNSEEELRNVFGDEVIDAWLNEKEAKKPNDNVPPNSNVPPNGGDGAGPDGKGPEDNNPPANNEPQNEPEEKPEEKKPEEQKPNTINNGGPSNGGGKIDYDEMSKDPDAYYQKNKDKFDKLVEAYNKKSGKNITAKMLIKALIAKHNAGKK